MIKSLKHMFQYFFYMTCVGVITTILKYQRLSNGLTVRLICKRMTLRHKAIIALSTDWTEELS